MTTLPAADPGARGWLPRVWQSWFPVEGAPAHPPPAAAAPWMEEYEARLLYSAELAPQALLVTSGAQVVQQRVLDAGGDYAATAAAAATRTELVIVDGAVDNKQALLDEISDSGNGGNSHLEVVVLDSASDGIAQISAALAGQTNVAAVHILAHGADGEIRIGDTILDAAQLAARADEIAQWGQSLAPGADILLYGCDVAADAQGDAFVQALAQLTGADVAASTNLTGNAPGADWMLEYATGAIQSSLSLQASAGAAWQGTLALPVLSGANNLAPINEDTTTNPGTLVSALIAGKVSDADAGAVSGIAVTAVDNSNGTWQYTTDGTTWNNFGAPSATSARLLAADADNAVRFVPNTNFSGTVTNGITFHAWDQSNGSDGATIDTTNASAAVRDNFSTVSYSNNDGTGVARWSTNWTEVGDDGAAATGQVNAQGGVLSLTPTLLSSNSIWREVNLTGATSATLTLSYNNTLSLSLLGAVTLTVSNGATTSAAMTFAAGAGTLSIDISPYIGTHTRITLATSSVLSLGGSLAIDNVNIAFSPAGISTAAASSSITVNSVNDNPVLAGANNLAAINENDVGNGGTAVTALLAGHVTDPDPGALSGIAVTAVDNSQGIWQYSLNGGSTWLAFGAVSASSARLLAADANTYVRFVPNSNYTGTVTNGIRFVAWDQTFGVNGSAANVAGGAVTVAVLDQFNTQSYSDNDGSVSWGGDWVENDSNGGGATGGRIQVTGNKLDVDASNAGDEIHRTANLTGALNATLSLDYDDEASGAGEVDVRISNNGGSTYTTLAAFTKNNKGPGTLSLDISSFISATTTVQILVATGQGGSDMKVDNVQIAYGSAHGASITDAAASITVNPVNSPPVLANAGATTFTENAAAVAIDPALTVSDVDNTTLASATVSVIGNFTVGQDVLGFANAPATMGNIAGSYDAGAGVLTLVSTGASATLGQWQAALRSVTYSNTSENPATAVRSIGVQVNDGQGANNLSNTLTDTINITAVNDAPILTSGSSITYTENDAATVIDAALTVSDVDSVTFQNATIGITGGFTAGQDVLGYTNAPATMGNIAGSYDTGTGILTLASAGSTATLAQWQAALRSVTYNNSSENPNTSARTVSWQVNDGGTTNNLSNTLNSTIGVVAVNDAPVLANGSSITYTENDAATVINAALAVNDVDNTTLASATVSVTGNFTAGQDVLGYSNAPATMGNIAGSYDAGTGVLTLTSAGSTATLAQWQAALQAVTYSNGSNNPNTGARTVSWQVNDGGTTNNLSNTLNSTISVVAVNDAPVLANGGSITYTENDAATVINAALTVNDADNTTLASATVSITGNFTAGQDVLGYTNASAIMGNIAGSYDAGTGVLTLTSAGGIATLAQWQAALQSVTYSNSSDNPNTSARAVSWQVSDGGTTNNLSNTLNSTISVVAVNDAPVLANGGGITYTENDAATVINAALTVSDADSTTLQSATVSIIGNFTAGQDVLGYTNAPATMGNIAGSYDAGTGVLTLTSAGSTATLAQWQAALQSVTYSNSSDNPNTGTRTVSWQVNDGGTTNHLSNTLNSTISVVAVNDAPALANGGSITYTENDAATVINAALTVSDADSATLQSATASITGNFTAAQDVLGYVNAPATMGNIAGSYDAGTGVLTLTSAGGTATLAQWQAALQSVTYSNSSDNPNTGTRTVSWQVSDGSVANSLSNTLNSTISVVAVNDAPVLANGSSITYTENDAATVINAALTVNDVDNTTLASATVSVTGNFTAGQDVLGYTNAPATMGNIAGSYDAGTGGLTLTSAGSTATLAQWQAALQSVTYSNSSDNPNTGMRTIGWQVNDGGTTNNLSNTLNSTISVVAVNDAPVLANGGSITYTENDAATIINAALTVNDVDNTTLASATVSITGNFTAGQDVLGYTNAPVTMGNISGSYDAGTGVLTLSSAGSTATIAQWQAALRSVNYSNSSDIPATAARTLSVQVNDGQGANNLSNTLTDTVSITAVNDAPVLANGSGITYTENDAATVINAALTVSDADNTMLASATVSITSNFTVGQDVLGYTNAPATMGNIAGGYDTSTGVLTLTSAGSTATLAQWQAALQSVTYSNSSNNPNTGARTVSWQVNDGGTVNNLSNTLNSTLSVVAVNDAPILANGSSITYTENDAATVINAALTVNDVDNTTLASATVSVTGNFTAGQDVLGYTNAPATMGNIAGSYNAGSGVLTLSSAGGTATLVQWQAALQSVTYRNGSDNPNTGARTVNWQVNDGGAVNNLSNLVTSTLSVVAVNDAPVLANTGATTYTENGAAVAINPALTVSDVDNTTLASATVSITGNFTVGQDVLGFANAPATMGNIAGSYDAGTGVLTLTSAGGTATVVQWQAALRSVTYSNSSDNPATAARTLGVQVNDGQGANNLSNTLNDTVNIIAVNDAPVLANGSGITYTENDAATVINAALTVSDVDSATLQSAKVSISGGFTASQDALGFANVPATMGNIAGSYNAGTGVLTLTSAGGTATVAQWQVALRSVTYSNSSDNPNTGARTISWQVNDGGAANNLSNTLNSTIGVVAVNDAPVLANGSSVTYTENNAATLIDTALTVSDADNSTLASATVSITGNFTAGQDALGFTNVPAIMGNIAGSYDAGTGVLTLTSTGASATLAQWRAALRSVTYANSSDNPNTGARTVAWAVNDGLATSNAVTSTINIISVNDAPVVTAPGTQFIFENTPLVFSAANSNAISIADVDAGSGAELVTLFASGGKITLSQTSGLTVIAGSNGSATMRISGTLSDINAALAGLTFTPDLNDTGLVFFEVDVNDQGNTSTAPLNPQSDSAAFFIDIIPLNTAPLLTNGSTITYTENGAPAVVDASLSVSDMNSTTLSSGTVAITGNFAAGEDILGFSNGAGMGNIAGSYNATTGVLSLTSAGGTATLAQWRTAMRSVTYSNSSDDPSTTTRTVSWQVDDGGTTNHLSNTLTSDINVVAVNDPPQLANGGSAGYTENGAAVAINPALTVSDADNATLASATVTIAGNFNAAQDVLTFTNVPASMGNITASYNAAGGVLTLASAGSTATVAQWQAALRAVTYANSSDNPTTATRTLDLSVSDGAAGSNNLISTVSITVVNDAPVLANGSTLNYTENDAATPINTALVVTDVDNATLARAVVSFTGGFAPGQDVLTFSNVAGTMGNIAGSYDGATGVLTLSSTGATATLAQWQAALRAVTYRNSSDNPDAAARTVNWQVNDGGAANNLSNIVTSTINVAAVNDAPVLATGSTLNYIENAPAVPVDPLLTVTDADNATLIGATVSVGTGFVAGEDLLALGYAPATMGNITASFDAAAGLLTLNSAGGTATVAQWQAALRAVTYADSSDNPATAARTINWQVSDGLAVSNVLTSTVTVTAVNDAPVLANGSVLNYTENAPAAPINTGLVVNDVDNATLARATVSFSGGFAAGQDVLAFSNVPGTMGNISGSYDGVTGVLTLSSAGGTATLAQWQAALRTVTYANTSDNPATATRTINWQASDGLAVSNVVASTITVTAVNDPPVLANGSVLNYAQNDPAAVIDAALLVTDLDSPTLASATISISGGFVTGQDVLGFSADPAAMGNIAGSYNAATGVLTLSSAGGTATVAQWQAALRVVTYANTSGNPATATRTVDWQVSDGLALSNMLTSTVAVTAVNGAPVLANGSTLAYTENEPAAVINGGLVVTDPGSPTLAGATISISGGFVTGQDVLGFSADPVATGNIAGTYDTATGVLTLTSAGASASLAQWQAALRTVTYANTSDNPDTATRTVSWQVNDGGATNHFSNVLTSAVSITAQNDAPSLAGSDAVSYTENAPATAANPLLLVSDRDNTTLTGATVALSGNFTAGEDVLGFINDSTTMGNIAGSYDAAGGILTLGSAGGTATLAQWQAALRAVTYASSSDNPSTALRTLDWQVSDGIAASNVITSTVQVIAVNDAPVLAHGSVLTYTENEAATPVNPLLTVADADNGTLVAATVSIANGFTAGQDVLAYRNDAATMGNITGSYDAASGVLTLTSAGASATLAQWQAALRTVTYANTSDNPATAVRTLDWQVSDGQAANPLSNVVSSIIHVVAANNPATIGGDTAGDVIEAGGLRNSDPGVPVGTGMLTAVDADNLPDSFTAVGTPSASTLGYGSYTLSASGLWTYTLDNSNASVQALNVGGTLVDRFTVTTVDGTAQAITITIHGQNDTAEIGGADHGQVTEDSVPAGSNLAAAGQLTIADVDTGQASFQAQADAVGAYGSFTLSASGEWHYSAANDQRAIQQLGDGQSLSDSFTAVSADGSASRQVVVTIHGVNDAPTAQDEAVATSDSVAHVFNIAEFGYADTEGTPMAGLRVLSLPASGTLTLAGGAVAVNQVISTAAIGAGSFLFVPLQGNPLKVNTAFTFQVSDGTAFSAGHTVAIAVEAALVGTGPAQAADPGSAGPAAPPANAPQQSPLDTKAVQNQVGDIPSTAPPPVDTTAAPVFSPAVAAPTHMPLGTQDDDLNRAARIAATQSSGPVSLMPVSFDLSSGNAGREIDSADAETAARVSFALNSATFTEELDNLRDKVASLEELDRAVVVSSVTAGAGMSVGYVLWLLRGSVLLSSVLSSLPAWRYVDPLPVLGQLDDETEEDEESLESILGNGDAPSGGGDQA